MPLPNAFPLPDNFDDAIFMWANSRIDIPEDELFKSLHAEYNTVAVPLQNPYAFHKDVKHAAGCARNTEHFRELMAERSGQRRKELSKGLDGFCEAGGIFRLRSLHVLGPGNEGWLALSNLLAFRSLDNLVMLLSRFVEQFGREIDWKRIPMWAFEGDGAHDKEENSEETAENDLGNVEEQLGDSSVLSESTDSSKMTDAADSSILTEATSVSETGELASAADAWEDACDDFSETQLDDGWRFISRTGWYDGGEQWLSEAKPETFGAVDIEKPTPTPTTGESCRSKSSAAGKKRKREVEEGSKDDSGTRERVPDVAGSQGEEDELGRRGGEAGEDDDDDNTRAGRSRKKRRTQARSRERHAAASDGRAGRAEGNDAANPARREIRLEGTMTATIMTGVTDGA